MSRWNNHLTFLPNEKNFNLVQRINTEDISNVAKTIGVVSERVVNMVGKGEHAYYQHFFPFQIMLSEVLFPWTVKTSST